MAKKIYVVGNSVDIPDDSRISQHNNNDTIMFIGKMSYNPNIVAVTFFVTQVFPTLRLRFPRLKFVIVGANPDVRVQKLANNENVIVTGFVDSIEPYLQRAAIVVAPMLTGAGVQNKIIQAMSYACCILTTSIGAEGLNIMNNEVAIVDDAKEMIERITFLLRNRNERCLMGTNARQYVINNLSEEVIGEQFWTFLEIK